MSSLWVLAESGAARYFQSVFFRLLPFGGSWRTAAHAYTYLRCIRIKGCQNPGRKHTGKRRILTGQQTKKFPSRFLKISIPPAPFTALKAAGKRQKPVLRHPAAVSRYAVKTGNPPRPLLHPQSHPPHGSVRPKAPRHGFSVNCSAHRRYPYCRCC